MLDGLLTAVDLPPMKDATVAVSLGKVESVPNPDLAVQLLGGETIAKGNPKFDVMKDGDALSWSVRMTERNKDDAKIARSFSKATNAKSNGRKTLAIGPRSCASAACNSIPATISKSPC